MLQIGMLSLGYPKINFQVASAVAEGELTGHVSEALSVVAEQRELLESSLHASSSGLGGVAGDGGHQMAFQELFELAQRKLLRQVSRYCSDRDPYPRIFVPDFKTATTAATGGDVDASAIGNLVSVPLVL